MPDDELFGTFPLRRDRCGSKIDRVGPLKFLLPTDVAHWNAHEEKKYHKDDERIGLNLFLDIIPLIKGDLNILILKA